MGYETSSVELFLKTCKKKVLCFGAGSYFQIMYYDFKQRKNDFQISCIIDNNPEKAGKQLEIGMDVIPIYSLSDIMHVYKKEEIVVLITTAFHQEVLHQMEQLDFFKEINIYSYFELKKNSAEKYDFIDSSVQEAIIPKKINYCWFGGKAIPLHLQRIMDSWKSVCPDYEIIRWDESNYDIMKNSYTEHCYKNKMWAHLTDYVRLDIVFNHGGIYLDTDVELLKPLDPLLYNEAFFGTEVSGGIASGLGFGAVSGHPILRQLMDVYERIDTSDPVAHMTNLGKEVSVFYKNGYINNGRFQVIKGTAIYPYQVLAPKIKETGECLKTNATIAIHHFEGAWC